MSSTHARRKEEKGCAHSKNPGELEEGDVELELWSYGGVKDEDMGEERWHGGWCRPSCIPISVILVLIVLVVLLPLLDQKWDTSRREETSHSAAMVSLVESIPEGLLYPDGAPSHASTYDTWMDLLGAAESSIEIASFYWSLRGSDLIPYPTADKNSPSKDQPNLDTELLTKRNAAEVRSLNFAQLVGGGVLHTKFWLVDRKHAYVGSANMDWRSLTEVKEMGVAVYNCSCIATDLGKIFDSSPPQFCPRGRTSDIDSILDVISTAERYIHISVMELVPLTVFTPKIKFWPAIENALRAAAVDHKVRIRLLISHWNHTLPAQNFFLRSMAALSGSFPWVQKLFVVPATEAQSRIPYARVNHNKYMVTDNAAYIETRDEVQLAQNGVRHQLTDVFDRDWYSEYAHDLPSS
ncbi:hypothetical protein B566_EDAN009793 [Ephemera danica]|nr:hypothetical protein B566_EDAN009793 [Ephemera danica]